MTHIDEGTIHAWIDGALDATRSREIETHVAECSVCASAVAEARGLVAGASRILLALDDVPAGVTPKRTLPAAPRRQWRAAPWVTGIAAALVLAIGITTWDGGAVVRRVEQSDRALEAPDVPPLPAVGSSAQLPRAAGPADSAPANRAVVSAPVARSGMDQPRTQASRARGTAGTAATSPARRATDLAAAGAGAGGTQGEGARERRSVPRSDAAAEVAASVSAPPPSAPAPPAMNVAKAEAAGVRPEASSRLDFRAADSRAVTPDQALAATRLILELAGCYRMERSPGPTRQLGGIEVLGRRAAGKAVASAAAAAPAREYSVRMPEILRLDTVQKAMGYVVRADRSDSTIGWWSRVGEDTARVELLSGASFTLIGKTKVNCP